MYATRLSPTQNGSLQWTFHSLKKKEATWANWENMEAVPTWSIFASEIASLILQCEWKACLDPTPTSSVTNFPFSTSFFSFRYCRTSRQNIEVTISPWGINSEWKLCFCQKKHHENGLEFWLAHPCFLSLELAIFHCLLWLLVLRWCWNIHGLCHVIAFLRKLITLEFCPEGQRKSVLIIVIVHILWHHETCFISRQRDIFSLSHARAHTHAPE